MWEGGNEGTGLHGGEELTGVGGYGASWTKVFEFN